MRGKGDKNTHILNDVSCIMAAEAGIPPSQLNISLFFTSMLFGACLFRVLIMRRLPLTPKAAFTPNVIGAARASSFNVKSMNRRDLRNCGAN